MKLDREIGIVGVTRRHYRGWSVVIPSYLRWPAEWRGAALAVRRPAKQPTMASSRLARAVTGVAAAALAALVALAAVAQTPRVPAANSSTPETIVRADAVGRVDPGQIDLIFDQSKSVANSRVVTGTPSETRRSHRETGIASVYGPEDGGGIIAATGERIDHSALTAAHKTLPLGTLVEITNMASRKHAVFRINDRGPYVADRVIDLTEAGARKLRVGGLAAVQLSVVPSNGCTFAERFGAGVFIERSEAQARSGCSLEDTSPKVAQPTMTRAQIMGTGGTPPRKKAAKDPRPLPGNISAAR